MINSRDLRVGNYVMDEFTGEWMVIEKIKENKITATLLNSNLFPLPEGWEISPIPLTRDVLKLCSIRNFQITTTQFDFLINVLFIGKNGVVHDSDIKVVRSASNELPFQYLHQLQNLCYLLTGEELVINLYKIK